MANGNKESDRSWKIRQALLVLVPFVYGAVTLQSVTDKLFPEAKITSLSIWCRVNRKQISCNTQPRIP